MRLHSAMIIRTIPYSSFVNHGSVPVHLVGPNYKKNSSKVRTNEGNSDFMHCLVLFRLHSKDLTGLCLRRGLPVPTVECYSCVDNHPSTTFPPPATFRGTSAEKPVIEGVEGHGSPFWGSKGGYIPPHTVITKEGSPWYAVQELPGSFQTKSDDDLRIYIASKSSTLPFPATCHIDSSYHVFLFVTGLVDPYRNTNCT